MPQITAPPPTMISTAHPVIIGFTQTQDPIVEGNQLVMECMVEGTPRPTVTWTKDNTTLENTGGIFITPDGRVAQVRIDPVSTEDSGLYSCKASNEAGSVENLFLIKVLGETDINFQGPKTFHGSSKDIKNSQKLMSKFMKILGLENNKG